MHKKKGKMGEKRQGKKVEKGGESRRESLNTVNSLRLPIHLFVVKTFRQSTGGRSKIRLFAGSEQAYH